MKINRLSIIFLALLFSTLFSCGENTVYQDQLEFKNGKWPAEYDTDFKIEISDTSSNYHIAYTLRNSLDYPYYNLYLKYKLKDSIGNTIDESLQELLLMDKKTGEPYGRGFGQKYDHQFLALKNFKFPAPGTYHFKVNHFMRHDSLPQIYALGLKVLKLDKQTD